MNAASALLQFQGISKRFGGTQAVDNVTLDVRAGEILALLGENGAGKSTLIKLLAGIYPADQGEILFDGRPQADWRRSDRREQPVAFIHQDLGLVEWMTVAENVGLGTGYPRRFGLIDWSAANDTARRVMARVGCDIDPGRRVFSLTRAEKSLLAIGRALEVKARLLVLDEPSASLPMSDVERMFGVLRELRRQGMAMLYVSHRLDEVLAISDRAAVMRDGKLVAVKDTAQTNEGELVGLIVGKALSASVQKAKAPEPGSSEPVLQLDGAASGNAGPLSLAVHRGEVLGLVGLRGAGHEAISRAIFGREPLSAGRMRLLGNACAFTCSADAIRAGVAYVAGERLEENLAGSMTVLENLFPNAALHGDRGLAFDRPRRENDQALALIRRFDVNPPAPSAEVQQLSGGNQQKVVLARWFHLDKPLVVLEEPTAGVDVGAKRQIYGVLRERAEAGTALVVVSTDFEEIATVCTRVLVFRDGLIAAELTGDAITVEKLLALAAGAATREEIHA
ncbi:MULTISPECIES: sugar ABC transporter ATP-binding protein [Variovorax]|jgi:ribose transport system ATP-binding protein|uniref:sugar ABC transporter ATP-binding protein n=1 Tax=Variovorax TaxID=34072 RepID=UPI000898AAE3|nr:MULTISPECIES: sugar ABC transporter ATP-binding protein [unclassified Variovorax]SDZ18687.1 monosaccharide ABC transporter ATP-binding protein, CUT2 family [Variovorax sp. YR634]SET64640.1 monosaccharide ABC transporter ATP-binding protein, CUT2 family [Variovorax sp. OV084]SOD25553.1 monosaccharide ABC transporter ATP-binding protein, CUT2 family [Variovorax sp. YR752]